MQSEELKFFVLFCFKDLCSGSRWSW